MDYKVEVVKLLFEVYNVRVWLLFGRSSESAVQREMLNSSLPPFLC